MPWTRRATRSRRRATRSIGALRRTTTRRAPHRPPAFLVRLTVRKAGVRQVHAVNENWTRPGATRRTRPSPTPEEDETMNLLWALAFVFVMLWMVGFFAFHVTSGLVHVLLVLAVVAVVFRLVSGRRVA